jgi:hypothetical protein
MMKEADICEGLDRVNERRTAESKEVRLGRENRPFWTGHWLFHDSSTKPWRSQGARRINYNGAGGYVLPDGTTVVGDGSSGFRLANGAYVAPDGAGGVTLPNGTRCISDGAQGHFCP